MTMWSFPISAEGPTRTVAIIDPLGSHGGFHYYVHNQANSLADLGNRVLVFGPDGDRLEPQRYERVKSFRRLYSHGSKAVRGLRLAWQLAVAAWRARLSGASHCVLHIFRADLLELFPLLLCRLLGMRTVCFIHDVERLDNGKGRNVLGLIMRFAGRPVVHNQFSRQALLRRLGTAPEIAVVPHGNYIADFPNPPGKAEARARLGLPAETLVLLFFGNFRKTKGADVLVEALAEHRDDDLLVVVAGKMKPDDENRLRTRMQQLGIAARMDLRLGHVPDDLIADYFCAADFVLLPYLVIFESGVGLMAMSLGRPIIASDLLPLREIVGENQRGLLFEAANPRALSEAIRDALADPQLTDRLAEAARIYAREQRDWSISAKLLDDLLKTGTASGGADRSPPLRS